MKGKIVNPVIKDTATFIRTSAETGGKITELELTLQPNGGIFLHFREDFTKTFTAIDGQLGLRIGRNKSKILQPHETYSAPPNQIYSFFNPGDKEIRFKVEVTPGHEGFENSLRKFFTVYEKMA